MIQTIRLYYDSFRIHQWVKGLSRPIQVRDRLPYYLFAIVFCAYWIIGQLICEFGGFSKFNYFFNADCPRVLHDMVRTHREATSGAAVSVAHPLFVLISNLPTALLSRALARSELAAALLVCHAMAASSVVLFYLVLRRLLVARWIAFASALSYGLSASQLIAGGLIETYSFVAATIMLGIWMALGEPSLVRNAFAQALAFGMHITLAGHTLFVAPLLWLGRGSFRSWVARVVGFWVLLALALGGLLYAQHHLYPDTDVTRKDDYHNMMGWSHPPSTKAEVLGTAKRLLPHVVLFNVVAPHSRNTGEPERITTFMWNDGAPLPKFRPVGIVLAVAWGMGLLGATWAHFRRFLSVSPTRRAMSVLLAGWILAVSAFFLTYGDDLLLYSGLWNGHVLLWVSIGLSGWLARTKRQRLVRILCFGFVGLLAINDAQFVHEMIRHYHSQDLLTF